MRTYSHRALIILHTSRLFKFQYGIKTYRISLALYMHDILKGSDNLVSCLPHHLEGLSSYLCISLSHKKKLPNGMSNSGHCINKYVCTIFQQSGTKRNTVLDLNVSMYVSICTYTHTHTQNTIYIHACMHTYVHTYIYTYIHIYTHTYIHTYKHIHI